MVEQKYKVNEELKATILLLIYHYETHSEMKGENKSIKLKKTNLPGTDPKKPSGLAMSNAKVDYSFSFLSFPWVSTG